MSTPRHLQSAMALLARFRRDKSANIAVLFAIATLPILTAVGCAVDYSFAARMKAKLQSAADAAAIASIAVNSAGYRAASLMTSSGPVPAGVTEANNIFNGNMATTMGYNNLSVTSTVTKTGPTLASTVTFSAQVPVTFMKVVGWQFMTVTGISKASSSQPPYLDFYLTLDVSGSMGLPSTTAEANRMQAISPDNYVQYSTGCTLACHFAPQSSACIDPAPNTPPGKTATQRYLTNNYCMGYVYSRLSQTALANLINQPSTPAVTKAKVPGLPDAMWPGVTTNVTAGASNSLVTGNPASLPYSLAAVSSCPTDGTDSCIQLRLDAVGYAVNQLLQKASDPTVEVVPNQFRIGIYPFIRFVDTTYAPLTSNITGSAIASAAANLASQLDTNTNANLGSGGTHIDNALSSINTLIASVGDGSASNNTQPYVFLVTDGAQDPQTKGVPNGGWAGSNHATVIDPVAVCKPLKDRGITISVLYIPYVAINPVNASFAGDEDDAANNNIPNIQPSLQACASPGFFYSASTPTGITDSLNKMFNHAVATAHVTN
jgi:Flp pilus assembly protein TadG